MGTSLGLLMQAVVERPGRSERPRRRWPAWLRMASALGMWLCFACLGAACISTLEGWAWIDGLFWAVVTLATVGYGAYVPSSELSRLFASLFMLVGVACTGQVFSALSALPLEAHKARLREQVLSQYGDELDEASLWELAAGDQLESLGLSASRAYVTRNEFCLAMLVRMEKITADDLAACQKAFDQLDADGSGRLDAADLEVAARQRAGTGGRGGAGARRGSVRRQGR